MPFDVFALRDRIVGEYREYFESFVNIFDKRVEAFVRAKLAEGELAGRGAAAQSGLRTGRDVG